MPEWVWLVAVLVAYVILTRTIDLFRVKVGLTHTYNNFHVPPETAKPV